MTDPVQPDPEDRNAEADAPDRSYTVAGRPRRKLTTTGKVAIGAAAVAALGIAGFQFLGGSGISTDVETSQSEEFQDPQTGEGFGKIVLDAPAPSPRIEVPQFDPSPLEAELDLQRVAIAEKNARLEADLATVKDELARLANNPGGSEQALAEVMQKMQAQNESFFKALRTDMETRFQEASLASEKRLSATEQMLSAVLRQNDALQDELANGRNAAAEEAASRAELNRRRAEAEALRTARVHSEGVIFDNGPRSSGGGYGDAASAALPAGGASGDGRPPSPDAAAREFVTAGAKAVKVTQAEVIANPANTVLQGTVIQATLETAIDSSLPGQIAAIVSYPVWSFDQSRVLIPEGSRLIGTYSSDVSLGQRRVLVGWTRLVTPEGQSVELAAFGADDQGRSGVTGHVNSRFGMRFGSAALLSIVGAAPALAASQADNQLAADTAEDIADNFSDTTATVIGQYASLPPIISVQPGAAISVLVDRDLEFF